MPLHIWILTALSVVVISCSSSTDPDDIRPLPPVSVVATSTSSTSVMLTWEAVSTDANRTGFRVDITEVGGTGEASRDTTIDNPASLTIITIDNLTAGTRYTFSVYALNGSTASATAATVVWSPAMRYSMRVYEPRSENGNGIQLSHPVSLLLPAAFKWDLCLDVRDDSVFIGCPLQSSFARPDSSGLYVNGDSIRRTVIGTVWPNVTSPDDVTADLKTDTYRSILLNAGAVNAMATPFVFAVRTQAGTYAKVLVNVTNGRFLQGDAPDRYLDLDIVYQPLVGEAFLKQ